MQSTMQSNLNQKSQFSYLCEFNISWIADYGTIWIFITGIADQLLIPHSVVVLPVCALREYCYSRPGDLTVGKR